MFAFVFLWVLFFAVVLVLLTLRAIRAYEARTALLARGDEHRVQMHVEHDLSTSPTARGPGCRTMSEHGRSSDQPMRVPTCKCGATGLRDPKFDAYHCPTSGVWLEAVCGESGCDYCTARPTKHE
jgi:hypothetical protein